MQRHHLLPWQFLSARCFVPLFGSVGCEKIGFDNFRLNGLLLPSSNEAAMRIGLPLHRGPHGSYNAMVAERVGNIESDWSQLRRRAPEVAENQTYMRFDLLQHALRRRLLTVDRPRIRLNNADPLGGGLDFSVLDAMAETLWVSTVTLVNAEE